MQEVVKTLKETFTAFYNDECMSMAAALAYYVIFALPSLLVVIITVAGLIVDPQAIHDQLISQVRTLIGPEGAGQVQSILSQAQQRSYSNTFTAVLGGAVLVVGATVAFAYLQSALNKIWKVKPDPNRNGFVVIIIKRAVSFAMVISIAFLLLVSIVVSAVVAVVTYYFLDLMPALLTRPAAFALDIFISFTIYTLIFAAIFKILPDAEVRWHDVWIGAVTTAALFQTGKYLIGLYLSSSYIGSAYGAAGSLAIVLIWFYYSSIILFLGAEFTQTWACRYGKAIVPEKGAVRIE